jgi:hypothetical protein
MLCTHTGTFLFQHRYYLSSTGIGIFAIPISVRFFTYVPVPYRYLMFFRDFCVFKSSYNLNFSYFFFFFSSVRILLCRCQSCTFNKQFGDQLKLGRAECLARYRIPLFTQKKLTNNKKIPVIAFKVFMSCCTTYCC